MSFKVILLLSLLCATLSLSLVRANRPRLLGAAPTGDALVQKACNGIGQYEPECLKLLQSSGKLDKYMDLAFFTLRYIEGQALNITEDIKKDGSLADIEPLFQAALTECMKQYIPLDDLVEDAINAMLAMSNSDSRDFIEAAIASTDMCNAQLQSTLKAQKTDLDTKLAEAKAAETLKQRNDFLKAMLNASLNIVALYN